jgi:GAF domain-containing protein
MELVMPRDGGLKRQGSRPSSPPREIAPAFRTDLRAVVSSAYETVETVDWATLMFAPPDERRDVEADEHIREIEAKQCADEDGPMFEARRTRRICRIASTSTSPGWPVLRELCRRHGVMSVASLPIIVEGVVVATMNLYSRDYHAFGPAETRAALRLAEHAAQLIAADR